MTARALVSSEKSCKSARERGRHLAETVPYPAEELVERNNMLRMLCGLTCAGLSIATLGAAQDAVSDTQPAAVTEVRGGSVTFDVETNVFAVTVHGESKALAGKVQVHETATGLELNQL